ncbi:MAG: hypothetical protein JWR77_270 [Rhizorhabdus sp.]|nr:hypothetical protein [Rhizorhabdus sp.]
MPPSSSFPATATSLAHLGLLDDEEIELDMAALELSALDHDGLDTDPYIAILSGIGENLAMVGRVAHNGAQQAGALALVIAGHYGFVGDRTTYDAPLNADMIRVIDRRKGLPVSLAILYVSAARRMGWTAHALNTPGHVLVSIGDEALPVIVDPFNGGSSVAPGQVAALVAQMGGHRGGGEDYLAPMTNRMVLVRLLMNQATRAEQAGDPARAMTVYERMTIAAPSHGQGWWDLARLQLANGDTESARDSLSAMLEVTRDRDLRAPIAAALDAIAGR